MINKNETQMDIDSVARRAAFRIYMVLPLNWAERLKNDIQKEVRAALVEFWPSVYRTPEDERERFEQAAYAHYRARHAAGKTADKDDPVGTREQLLWRTADGNYGVLMLNASWWAWQEAVKP